MKEKKDILMTVEKTISMAHFVHTDEESKCSHLHGHNWKFSIEIIGEKGEDEMVIDKAEIDEYLEQLDHQTVVPKSLVIQSNTKRVKIKQNGKKYVLPSEDVLIADLGAITCENIAKNCSENILNKGENIHQVEVIVQETDKLRVKASVVQE